MILNRIKFLAIAMLFFVVACAKPPVKEEPKPQVQMTTSASSVSHQKIEDKYSKLNFTEINKIYFDFDVSSPRSDQTDMLQKQTDYIIANIATHSIKKIVINGYTDKYGTKEYNLALGAKRANSIKSYYTTHGIDVSMIEVRSYGSEPSMFASETDQSLNRRTETVLTVDLK